MCIGLPFAQIEARLVLAAILQRFTPELVPGYRVEALPRVTLRVKHGLPMSVHPTKARVPALG
jgi:cytochrome P450